MTFAGMGRIILKSLYNKKFVVVILLAMSTISVYMMDVVATDFISKKYYIDSISSMFGCNPDRINYVDYLELLDPDYSEIKGNKIIQYIAGCSGVVACGRFCYTSAHDVLNGHNVKALAVERDIINVGDLGIELEPSDFSSHENLVYIGYDLRNEFRVGDRFNFYRDSDDCVCRVAGYLKKDASWPIKGRLFDGISGDDSYTLNGKIVVIPENYSDFDNSGGLPDKPYFIVDEGADLARIQTDIIKMAAREGLGVRVVNCGKSVKKERENNNIVGNKSFTSTILLLLLSIISMSAASIVFCLMQRHNHGIMMACGITKLQLAIMNFVEILLIVVVPHLIVWLIRNKEIFGSFLIGNNNYDMLMYPYWYAHSICIPIIYVISGVIVTFIAGTIPAMLIRRMDVSEILRSIE